MKRTLGLVSLTVLLLLSASLFFTQLSQNRPPSLWRVQPGFTTQDQVREKLGNPDQVETVETYQVFRYLDRLDLGGWRDISLWFQLDEGKEKLILIILEHPRVDKSTHIPISDINTLPLLTEKYGKPGEVYWRSCYSRFLLWRSEGIGASANADRDIEEATIGDIYIYDLVLFTPENEDILVNGPWTKEYAEPRLENPCFDDEHTSDPNPMDPYNWDLLLSDDA